MKLCINYTEAKKIFTDLKPEEMEITFSKITGQTADGKVWEISPKRFGDDTIILDNGKLVIPDEVEFKILYVRIWK